MENNTRYFIMLHREGDLRAGQRNVVYAGPFVCKASAKTIAWHSLGGLPVWREDKALEVDPEGVARLVKELEGESTTP